MKCKSEHRNGKAAPGKESPRGPDTNPQPPKFPEPDREHEPEKQWINPYPCFPAIGEGRIGSIYISVVCYSLN